MDILSDALPGRLLLFFAPAGLAREKLAMVVARLALGGSLFVIDGGNDFDAYAVARAVRRQTHSLDHVLARIRLARAFTCYQMMALLARTPAAACPAVVMNFLSSFYDDNVPLPESRLLLQAAVGHLHRLSRVAPIIVHTGPPPVGQPERLPLLHDLRAASGHVYLFEPPPFDQPLRLF